MFGFGKRNEVSVVEETEPVLTLESAVRFIVDAGYQVQGSYVRLMEVNSRTGIPTEKNLREAVENTVNQLTKLNMGRVTVFVQEVKERVATRNLVEKLTGEFYFNLMEATRSRAMVKAVRAGLDRSDAFLKLVESKDLQEIAQIDAWIGRTNAYQAVAA